MAKRENPRAHRLADQIQRELAQIIRDELKDPRASRLTVTSVEVAPDLSHARVFVTHLAGREHAEEALAGLRHAAGFLRSQLGARLSVYSVPTLAFAYDDSIEAGIRLSGLIDQALEQDRKRQG